MKIYLLMSEHICDDGTVDSSIIRRAFSNELAAQEQAYDLNIDPKVVYYVCSVEQEE